MNAGHLAVDFCTVSPQNESRHEPRSRRGWSESCLPHHSQPFWRGRYDQHLLEQRGSCVAAALEWRSCSVGAVRGLHRKDVGTVWAVASPGKPGREQPVAACCEPAVGIRVRGRHPSQVQASKSGAGMCVRRRLRQLHCRDQVLDHVARLSLADPAALSNSPLAVTCAGCRSVRAVSGEKTATLFREKQRGWTQLTEHRSRR